MSNARAVARHDVPLRRATEIPANDCVVPSTTVTSATTTRREALPSTGRQSTTTGPSGRRPGHCGRRLELSGRQGHQVGRWGPPAGIGTDQIGIMNATPGIIDTELTFGGRVRGGGYFYQQIKWRACFLWLNNWDDCDEINGGPFMLAIYWICHCHISIANHKYFFLCFVAGTWFKKNILFVYTVLTLRV